MKKIHILLHDDTNIENFPTNTLYVGEVTDTNVEYLAIKDEFGDTIKLRDEQTTDIENFAKNFIDVNTNVTWNENPKIVFQISEFSDKKNVLCDLNNKLKNIPVEIKPMKEVLQLDNNRYELVPFISAHGSFLTMSLNQNRPDYTINESIRTLLTDIWKFYDIVLMKLWEAYKNLANLLSSLALSTAKQFSRIVKIDMAIIETKIRIDNMLNDMRNVDWVERRWIRHTIDLRSQSASRLYQLVINSKNDSGAAIGKWFIIQDTPIDSVKNKIGTALLEIMAGNKVIDYKVSNSGLGGVKLLPIKNSDTFPLIALHGGARYHIFRTPQGTNPIDGSLVEVTAFAQKYVNLNRVDGYNVLFADDIKIGSNEVYLKEYNGSQVFKLKLS